MADTLQDQQFALSRHLRDPSHPPPPGIEERRLAIYRDLFFNNIESLLAGNFPAMPVLLAEVERIRVLQRAAGNAEAFAAHA